MPLRLTLPEYILARLNLLPTPLFDTPLGAGIAKVLVYACELGMFDVLSAGPLSPEALARRLEVDPQGLQLITPILIAAGYLRYRGGRFHNTRLSQRWLTSASRTNVAPYIIHSPDIVAIWDHLPEVVRENKQAMRMPYEDDATLPKVQAALARHYAGLAALAMTLGGEVMLRARLPQGATQLLDVGGSHAAYSVLFCRRHPDLHATIIDIQPGIEAGQRTVKQMCMSDRVSFVCADIVRDDFAAAQTEQFDVALYFHIAHLLPPEINAALLAKVARTLRPGGLLIFVDQITDQTRGSRLAALLVQFMSLTMTTVGGTCYPFPTVKGWLEEAGLGLVRRHRLLTPGTTMITARK